MLLFPCALSGMSVASSLGCMYSAGIVLVIFAVE